MMRGMRMRGGVKPQDVGRTIRRLMSYVARYRLRLLLVVLCIILFNTPTDTYVSYALNRMVDTGVGVIFSMLINYLLPRERLEPWLEKLRGSSGRVQSGES